VEAVDDQKEASLNFAQFCSLIIRHSVDSVFRKDLASLSQEVSSRVYDIVLDRLMKPLENDTLQLAEEDQARAEWLQKRWLADAPSHQSVLEQRKAMGLEDLMAIVRQPAGSDCAR